MSEAALQNKIKKHLKAKGFLVYKFASPSSRGVPDLLVITPRGDTFFIEVKNPNGKGVLSMLQKQKINEIQQHGVLVLVTDNFEDATSWVDKFVDVMTSPSEE